ncbi:MoaD/ThiS family protein [Salinispora fenicalii]|uniref:MoaD/ThiS family protein n=1 Tax=Salinispora fenicalii TaxID=1137263 RepID=UPI00037C452E|nr:MoaD/ThiS family protein [Salinispora fenicalii]
MSDLRGPTTDARPDRMTATLTIRYFAGARAAAGCAEEHLPAGRSLEAVLTDIADRHGERLHAVLGVASFLVDGVNWHDRRAPLPAGATIDVLPPFAGG